MTRNCHWILVVLICLQPVYIIVKGYFEEGSLPRVVLMQVHQVSGAAIFLIAICFIGWRLSHSRPSLPDTLKPVEKVLAHLVHGLLFFVLLAKPFTGYFLSLAKDLYIPWLGITNWSGLVAPDPGLADIWLTWHTYATYLLVFLVGIHIAAVLKHQLILKDNTLYRMLPWARLKQQSTARKD